MIGTPELQPSWGLRAEAAQARHVPGWHTVEAIAAVEGIDMIAYGHSDLSARLSVNL